MRDLIICIVFGFYGIFAGAISSIIGHLIETKKILRLNDNRQIFNMLSTLVFMGVLFPVKLLFGLVLGPIRTIGFYLEHFDSQSHPYYKKLREIKLDPSKRLVILAEDEPSVLELMVKTVEKAGYQVIPATNGLEALMAFKFFRRYLGFAGNHVKCILTDIRMPLMTGTQLLGRLRKIERGNSIVSLMPIIFVTAYDDTQEWHEALKNRIHAYLVKPIDIDEMLKTISEVIDASDPSEIFENMYLSGVERFRKFNYNGQIDIS
jgi:CheY-like chemotaxis protein